MCKALGSTPGTRGETYKNHLAWVLLSDCAKAGTLFCKKRAHGCLEQLSNYVKMYRIRCLWTRSSRLKERGDRIGTVHRCELTLYGENQTRFQLSLQKRPGPMVTSRITSSNRNKKLQRNTVPHLEQGAYKMSLKLAFCHTRLWDQGQSQLELCWRTVQIITGQGEPICQYRHPLWQS